MKKKKQKKAIPYFKLNFVFFFKRKMNIDLQKERNTNLTFNKEELLELCEGSSENVKMFKDAQKLVANEP